MAKKLKIEDDNEEFIIPNTVVGLEDLIEELFLNKGKGRPSKEWKEKINILITKCNERAQIKIYNLVK